MLHFERAAAYLGSMQSYSQLSHYRGEKASTWKELFRLWSSSQSFSLSYSVVKLLDRKLLDMAVKHCHAFQMYLRFVLVLCLIIQGGGLPVLALQKLQDSTVPRLGETIYAGAIATEQQDERLRRGAKGLPTDEEGLKRVLDSGKLEDGMIAKADSVTACLIRAGQGRRVSILNSFLELVAFTEIKADDENQKLISRKTFVRSPQKELFTPIDSYPLENLQASGIEGRKNEVKIINKKQVTDSAYAKDLREVCDTVDVPKTAVAAAGAETLNLTGEYVLGEVQPESPFARLPDHTAVVRVRYDSYEVVLQSIAVALLLLDLFILDDFQHKKLKFYHVSGVALLVIATVVTVVMGYFQVLEVLSSESYAWTSCGSYRISGAKKNESKRRGVQYDVLCHWVVVKAESTAASYLILIPSALGALLLLILVARFTFLRYRSHQNRLLEEQDDESKFVEEREKARNISSGPNLTHSASKKSRLGFMKKAIFTSAIAMCICAVSGKDFPPKSVERIGMNFIANGDVLYVGGVAVASPWRCTWESAKGPVDDVASLTGVDDCYARWSPPKEDQSTGLLVDEGIIKFERCNPPGKQCPFTGTRCRATDPTFDCRPRFKVPKPIKFLSQWQVDVVKSWCSFGSETRKSFCRMKCIRRLAHRELKMLTHEIKTKLGDERINVHRISEYKFPDCAGPPRNLSGSDSGKSTASEHFSISGDDCINSRELEKLAGQRARKACEEKLDAKKGVCKDSHWYGRSRDCRKRLTDICADAVYTLLLVKSKNMRAADDWLVSRCHQGGLTQAGPMMKNWAANKDSVVAIDDDIPKDKDTKLPFIRPVRQGWKFRTNPTDF